MQNGFVINLPDSCVYLKRIGSDCVLICLYVDDMLILGRDMLVVNETKKLLYSLFKLKDMGETDVILGLRFRKPTLVFHFHSHITLKDVKEI